MTRNLVAAPTAKENRSGVRGPGGYTFNAPIAINTPEGVGFTVAVVRLGDHAHLDIDSGWITPRHGDERRYLNGGKAGKLILRWHEWEVLRGLLDQHECIHIAEVENPTQAQLDFHVRR